MKLKAAIIGLGQIGIGFDLKENRSVEGDIWTHFSGYNALKDKFELVAAVDQNEQTLKNVSEYAPSLLLLSDLKDLEKLNIDVVSICTPDQFHYEQLVWAVSKFKGVFIEKPLFLDQTNEEIEFINEQIKKQNTVVYVNYYKRDEPSIQELMEQLKNHSIQKILLKYSGPFEAVGSHAIDLLNYIVNVKSVDSVKKVNEGCDVLLTGQTGESMILCHTGDRYKLIFELEVITDSVRFLLYNNLTNYRFERFSKSKRYANYFELNLHEDKKYEKNPFRIVSSLQNIWDEIHSATPKSLNFKKSLESQNLFNEVRTLSK